MTITDKKLIDALRRMAPETGSLICLGCGYERGCSVHGCAVLKAAVGRLEELTAPPSNAPLTLEELREMDGEPVWVEMFVKGLKSHWAIVHGEYLTDGRFVEDKQRCLLSIDENGGYGLAFLARRCRPEEGTT